MTALTLFQLMGLALLVLLSAFFSSSEVAFLSLNPLQLRRLKEERPPLFKKIEWILSAPTRLLSTVLIGNTIVNISISALTYAITAKFSATQSEALAMAASLFLLLIFGEIAPKRIAVTYPDRVSSLYTPALLVLIHALTPLRVVLEQITTTFAHLFHPRGRILSEDEFRTVVDLSEEEGVLDEDEKAMVKGIIRLEDLKASDVMTPRVDLIGINLDDRSMDVDHLVQRSNVRQILVYQGQLDNVVGFLDVRRYLLDPDYRIANALIPPLYVPEACPLDKLLARFLTEQRRAAVVVDEYGGTAGVVTRGDVMEEITGEIDDEKGHHQLLFARIGPKRWVMDGQHNLEHLRDTFHIVFEEEGVDRIAGWITAQLERMPRPGDRVETPQGVFTVRQMRRNRVTLIEFLKREKETA